MTPGLSCHEGDARTSVVSARPVFCRKGGSDAVADPSTLAPFVIGAFAGIGVWGIVAVLHTTWLTESQRMIAVGGVVTVMALLAAGQSSSGPGIGTSTHFVFGLDFRHGARARHPVRMTRHQGRDGCGAASASRLSRRRSFFFMPTT